MNNINSCAIREHAGTCVASDHTASIYMLIENIIFISAAGKNLWVLMAWGETVLLKTYSYQPAHIILFIFFALS